MIDGKPFDWRIKFARGQLTQGLVSQVIPKKNGYPMVDMGEGIANGKSLGLWFDPAEKGTHHMESKVIEP